MSFPRDTERNRKILELLASGLSQRAAARTLGLTRNTVAAVSRRARTPRKTSPELSKYRLKRRRLRARWRYKYGMPEDVVEAEVERAYPMSMAPKPG